MIYIYEGETMKYEPIYTHKPTKYIPSIHAGKIEGSFVMRKYDGQSMQATFNDGDIKIFANTEATVSKVFKEYTNAVPHIINELREIDNTLADLDIDGLHLQGEMYSDNLETEQANFNYCVGVLKDHNSYERQLKEGLVKFVIYDIPSLENYKYKDRYSYMESLFVNKSFKYISLAPILGINENGSWVEYFNDMVQQGHEGIVLYDPNALYKFTVIFGNTPRNNGIWKIKIKNEREVCVTEIIEGVGKYKDNVGALKCIDVSGKEFKVGSFAISDTEKQWIYDNCTPPFLIEMRYMEETVDSYRHPIMTRLRLDKDVEDWNPE
jgi:ATP-dependent DNA ligase